MGRALGRYSFGRVGRMLVRGLSLVASRLDTPTAADRLLIVAPHPDDETLGCGALIAQAKAVGAAVQVVIVTDGGASSTQRSLTREDLVATRRREALAATAELGLAEGDVRFLAFRDAEAEQQADAIAVALADLMAQFRPTRIFVTATTDSHSDHRAISRAAHGAAGQAGWDLRVYEYPIWQRTPAALLSLLACFARRRVRTLPCGESLDRKRTAILAYHSQFDGLSEDCFGVIGAEVAETFLDPRELFVECTVR